ncbi:MAG: DUF4296 domain-containing protein [Ignavibacteriaceae bacterium]|jgi:fructosamine-3-kinase|nr:DUF4296 domain-containing protein [Ignavibacteriaceae bacterium]
MPAKKKFWFTLLAALAIGFATIVFYAAKVKTIEQNTFVKFYTDYLIAQDSLGNDVASSKKIRGQLYKKYSITNEEYLSTINDYNSDQKKWAEFFGKVMENLEAQQKKRRIK